MFRINIHINERYYSKDPFSTELGRKLISGAVELIESLGFEQFTFKKLAGHIGSTEASIYRYFENKQKLLIYLTAWYWAWVDYRIDSDTHHLDDDRKKLERIWEILCHLGIPDEDISLDVETLRKIVVSEADKTYLTKHVDEINKEGLFLEFKSVCHRIATVFTNVDHEYVYPHAMVSTMIEASHQQYYFASHLPSLTELDAKSSKDLNQQVFEFIMDTLDRVMTGNKDTVQLN